MEPEMVPGRRTGKLAPALGTPGLIPLGAPDVLSRGIDTDARRYMAVRQHLTHSQACWTAEGEGAATGCALSGT